MQIESGLFRLQFKNAQNGYIKLEIRNIQFAFPLDAKVVLKDSICIFK